MNYVTGSAKELGTALVHELGRYRHRVFVRHLGWRLPHATDEMEWDQFDRPDTVYVLALSDRQHLTGCARLLPTTSPYLLADVFPELLDGTPAPNSETTWELSRFAAVDLSKPPESGHTLGSPASLALLRAAMRIAAYHGARTLVSVSPSAIQRILAHGGFPFTRIGQTHRLHGQTLFACGMHLQPALQAAELEA